MRAAKTLPARLGEQLAERRGNGARRGEKMEQKRAKSGQKSEKRRPAGHRAEPKEVTFCVVIEPAGSSIARVQWAATISTNHGSLAGQFAAAA